MKIIAISGPPGTGKTTIATNLAKQIDFTYVDISSLIKTNKIPSNPDKKRKCNIVDINDFKKEINNIINKSKKKNSKGIIIDSHLSYFISSNIVDLCIITKCELKELNKRLQNRNYSKEKIKENLDCEIFDVCLCDSQELNHNILIIDTSISSIKENLKKIVKKI